MRSTRTLLVLVLLLAGCHPLAPPAAGDSPTAASPVVAPPAPGPGATVVSARTTFPWGTLNGGQRIAHDVPVPPVPVLVTIGVGDHPHDPGERPYNRMTFSFATAMPAYLVEYVPRLVGSAKGGPIPLPGTAVLRITFTTAAAHLATGTSSVRSAPGPTLGLSRMLGYAQGGDFEGVLTYGIGVSAARPVRLYEATYRAPTETLYVVAVDVDAS